VSLIVLICVCWFAAVVGRGYGESELKRRPEWDDGLQRHTIKQKLIADLTEFLISIEPGGLKPRRDELVHRAAIELDPDAFALRPKGSPPNLRSVLDGAIARWKAEKIT
jgi:hypothetical protein